MRPLGAEVEAQSSGAHQSLRQLLHRIESAIDSNHFEDGARLLSELIEAVREHFHDEEAIALGAGLSRGAAGRLVHDALIDRARILQARCQNSQPNTPVGDIRNELVVLLSDMVESDIRIAGRIDGFAPNLGKPTS